MKEAESFYPETRQQWRQWLEQNHHKKEAVWLICYKKTTGKPSVSWSDAVDEALCFGWIDSTRRSAGNDSFIQFFTRRKASSTWSKINKEKIERLINEGLMTEAGLSVIELAKKNGSWGILDQVEELVIFEDLEIAFQQVEGSKEFFLGLSKSVRKSILQWVVTAKRAETRQKRVAEIAERSGQKMKPKHL